MKTLPKKLIFLGGGYIALEMAQSFRRFGADVVVLEQSGRLIEHEDDDVADTLKQILESEGISFVMNARITSVTKSKNAVAVNLADGKRIVGEQIFVATGREANTAYLGLETVGINRGKRGIVDVTPHLQTAVKNIWASGDMRGGPQFTNTAYDDFIIIRDQLLGGGNKTTRRVVDYAIFTDPELGRVGMSEAEAKESGKKFVIGRYNMADNGKARELGKTAGFIKVIVEKRTCRILGAAALCESGSEIVQLFTELIAANATSETMIKALQIHPTLAEAAKNAVASVNPR